jgi:hypothetical protein
MQVMVEGKAVVARWLRLLAVLACTMGASLGFAAGAHSTTHALAGPATPGHHHHSTGGPSPHLTDDGTQVRSRRMQAKTVRVQRPLPRATWVGLRSLVAKVVPRSQMPSRWLGKSLCAGAPEVLCVHRT